MREHTPFPFAEFTIVCPKNRELSSLAQNGKMSKKTAKNCWEMQQ